MAEEGAVAQQHGAQDGVLFALRARRNQPVQAAEQAGAERLNPTGEAKAAPTGNSFQQQRVAQRAFQVNVAPGQVGAPVEAAGVLVGEGPVQSEQHFHPVAVAQRRQGFRRRVLGPQVVGQADAARGGALHAAGFHALQFQLVENAEGFVFGGAAEPADHAHRLAQVGPAAGEQAVDARGGNGGFGQTNAGAAQEKESD